MEKKTKIIKDLQQEVSRRFLPTGNPQPDLFQVFIIQWYSCVCFCNFPKTGQRVVSNQRRPYGRNWSTSPECVVDAGVLFDRRCDCDCHGLCGWQIGSLSAASELCPPPDTTPHHTTPHLIWEQPHIRTSSFFRYLQDFTGTRLSARAALKNNKSYFQTCRATNTLQHRSQGWLFISLSNYKVAHERTYICF